jgi:hypothetical protein
MECNGMSNDSQIHVPDSFVALYVPAPGRKPSEPREYIAQRYELCEDMAQMLSETAHAKAMDLGVDEAQVLQRVHEGLQASAVLAGSEPLWVVRRIAEVLNWPLPAELDWRDEQG